MGEPVKIIDLAKKMIELSGFTTDQIPIEVTGIRPGEKLYEELLATNELDPEANVFPKIFVGCTRPFTSVAPILRLIEHFRQNGPALTDALLFVANSADIDRDLQRIFASGFEFIPAQQVRIRVVDGN